MKADNCANIYARGRVSIHWWSIMEIKIVLVTFIAGVKLLWHIRHVHRGAKITTIARRRKIARAQA